MNLKERNEVVALFKLAIRKDVQDQQEGLQLKIQKLLNLN